MTARAATIGMKTYLDCYPCFMRQALSAARRAGASTEQQRQILLLTMDRLRALSAGTSPPVMAAQIHELVRLQTHNADPYREAKQQATRQALALYPFLKEQVAHSADPVETAVRIAIAGNIIDLGVAETFDLKANLERVLRQDFSANDLPSLRYSLADAHAILYLADNAGETVFDRVLIETLELPVTYVVKASPIINDATREDAVDAGIDQVAKVIDNGSNAPGTLLDCCSKVFRKRFQAAELILAKGQGNYESLSDVPAPIFFLLQTKCAVIARDLGVPEGSIVLQGQKGFDAPGGTAIDPGQR